MYVNCGSLIKVYKFSTISIVVWKGIICTHGEAPNSDRLEASVYQLNATGFRYKEVILIIFFEHILELYLKF